MRTPRELGIVCLLLLSPHFWDPGYGLFNDSLLPIGATVDQHSFGSPLLVGVVEWMPFGSVLWLHQTSSRTFGFGHR